MFAVGEHTFGLERFDIIHRLSNVIVWFSKGKGTLTDLCDLIVADIGLETKLHDVDDSCHPQQHNRDENRNI